MFNLAENDIQAALAANGTPDGTNGAGLVGTAKRTMARFYMHATKDGDESLVKGRTIYKETPFVEMWAEGATDKASHAVTSDDRKAYPQEWAEFQRQLVDPVHSAAALPGFTASMRRYLEDAELFTIEGLATADVQPELESLKATAIKWLAMAKGDDAPVTKRGGRKLGSKNKPKVSADGQVA